MTSGVNDLHRAAANNNLLAIEECLETTDVNSVTKSDGRNALYYAVSNNHFEATRLLLRRGATLGRIKCPNPLNVAVMKNNIPILRLLVQQQDTQINRKDSKGCTALHYAAQHGRLAATQTLVEVGADINATDDQLQTPLHIAAIHRQIKICDYLCRFGAKMNLRDRENMTPLYLAIIHNNKRVVKLLLKYNADINPKSTTTSALHLAVQHGNPKIVRRVLNSGPNIFFKDANGQMAIDVARLNSGRAAEEIINMLELSRVLFEVVTGSMNNKIPLIKSLVSKGAVVNTCDNLGLTPLYYSFRNYDEKLTLLLLAKGKYCKPSASTGGKTFLHDACRMNSSEIVRVLLRNYGYDSLVNLKSDSLDGKTALHIAAEQGNANIVRLLLRNGAVYDETDNYNRKPRTVAYTMEVFRIFRLAVLLFTSIKYGHTAIAIDCLKKEGCLIMTKNSDRYTPLHLSVRQNQLDLVQYILKHLDTLCDQHSNLLYLASYFGYDRILSALLEHRDGRKLINSQCDADNLSPLHVAKNLQVAVVLLSNGAVYDQLSINQKTPRDLVPDSAVRLLLSGIDDMFSGRPTKIDKEQYPEEVFLNVRNSARKKLPRSICKTLSYCM